MRLAGATTEDRPAARLLRGFGVVVVQLWLVRGRYAMSAYDEGSGPEVRGPLPNVALAAQTELLDQRAIAVDVFPSQVVEQSAAAPDEQQQAAQGLALVRQSKDLIFYVTRARVPMPKSTRELLARCELFRATFASPRAGRRDEAAPVAPTVSRGRRRAPFAHAGAEPISGSPDAPPEPSRRGR